MARKKQKWSNGKILRRIVLPILVFLVAIIIIIGIVCVSNQPHPIMTQIGQPITMSVEEDQNTQGFLFGYTAGFPWASGSMQLTVDNANLYSSFTEAGIDPAECSLEIDPTAPFLVLDITIENIDAVLYEDMNFSVGHLVSSQAFEGWNVINGNYLSISPVYFSDHMPISSDSKDYFHGELPQGTSTTFQLGFSVSDLSADLVFELGNNGLIHKYGVELGIKP